jgi:hypothetical protein
LTRRKAVSTGKFVLPSNEGALLQVKVVPGAKKSALAGIVADRLKIRLQAPPVEGKANRELIRFLAAELGMKKNRLSLVSGEKSRDKTVLLSGISEIEAGDRLRTRLHEE